MTTFEQQNLQGFLNRLNSNTLTAGDQSVLLQTLTSIIAGWGNQGISVDPNTGVGTDPAPIDDEWFSVLYNEALGIASGGTLVPASWTQPTWFIDPSGLNGGSDTNTGFTSAAPLKTWARLQALWGTASPVLSQQTTVTFLSSHTDNTDPVTWTPILVRGAVANIMGALGSGQQIGTGTLSAVVSKNRAGGQLLVANLGIAVPQGTLIVNRTHPSRAWTYLLSGGTTWKMSQPLSPFTGLPMTQAIPSFIPPEVDTWANGDAFTAFTPLSINIAVFQPRVIDYNAVTFATSSIWQCTVLDPSGVGNDNLYIGPRINLIESVTQRTVIFENIGMEDFSETCLNCNLAAGAFVWKNYHAGSFWHIFAGIVQAPPGTNSVFGSQTHLDADVIVAANTNLGPAIVSFAYFETGTTQFVKGGIFIDTTPLGYGPSFAAWTTVAAPAILNMIGTKASWDIGQSAVNTFLNVTLELDGLTNALSINGTVLNSLALTPANLDAAAGAAGFGRRAFIMGGASLVGDELV